MALPDKYENWPKEAQDSYQSFKKVAGSLHDYINVTQDIMFWVQQLGRTAERVDAGDGKAFQRAEEILKQKFLTQTFH